MGDRAGLQHATTSTPCPHVWPNLAVHAIKDPPPHLPHNRARKEDCSLIHRIEWEVPHVAFPCIES